MTINYENPWIFEGKEVQSEDVLPYFGFVYMITDKISGKKYIGRKYIYTRRKEKGKSYRSKKESDWKNYYGSSKELLTEIEKNGKENYKREILVLCKGEGETNFSEVFAQFLLGVLESDDYINDQINGKWYKKNVIKYDAVKQLRKHFL